jgi:hypothetical protein
LYKGWLGEGFRGLVKNMLSAQQIVSYISVGLVLVIGIVVLSGVFVVLEPIYRFGIGIAIIAYAGVRIILLQTSDRRKGKIP